MRCSKSTNSAANPRIPSIYFILTILLIYLKIHEDVKFYLVDEIFTVSNLQRLKTQGSFLYVHGDIRNQNDVTRIVREFRPDAIFHLAGQVVMTTSIEDPRSDFEVNVLGSLNVLESSKIYSPDAIIIYSSSNKV